MQFKFFEDPGHGWMEVPVQLIALLGIRDRISAYSYRKGDMAYLEEDCDLSEFMEACRGQGIEVKYDRVYQEHTPIRNYRRFYI